MKSRCQITGLPLERFICRFMYWFIHPSIHPSIHPICNELASSVPVTGDTAVKRSDTRLCLCGADLLGPQAGHSLHMVAPVDLGLDPRGWVQVRDTNRVAMAMLTA